MSGIQPVAVYNLRIPPGDILVPAVPDFAAMFRVTMAAIDPSEAPELEDPTAKPRATLKVVRFNNEDMLDSDEDDEDDENDEDDEDEDDESNGGPSVKQIKKAIEADDEDMDDDEDESEMDEEETEALLAKLSKLTKGKGKTIAGEDDEDSDDADDEALELDETVLCTLDAERLYQQPLDFVVGEGEKVFFKVSGSHTIHLTGNYVMPLDEPEDDDEEDYDEDYDSADEDELDGLDALVDGDDESDDLDDLDDPRVMEVDSEEEKKTKATSKKGKNKRPADDSDDEAAALDDLMAKSIKKDEASTTAAVPEKKLSKAEKKAQKKQKNNEGKPVDAPTTVEVTKETKVNGTTVESDKKKVQFAKNLEQGPTPSKADAEKKPAAASTNGSLGVRNVNGVEVDDRKLGSGPAAKKGSRVEMRYIGKLKTNNKVFDSNKSGKPFSTKIGVGEVIKGWDVGLIGISAGGERRLTIPAKLAYGGKALPGIPANSDLVFDVKCLSVK